MRIQYFFLFNAVISSRKTEHECGSIGMACESVSDVSVETGQDTNLYEKINCM